MSVQLRISIVHLNVIFKFEEINEILDIFNEPIIIIIRVIFSIFPIKIIVRYFCTPHVR